MRHEALHELLLQGCHSNLDIDTPHRIRASHFDEGAKRVAATANFFPFPDHLLMFFPVIVKPLFA